MDDNDRPKKPRKRAPRKAKKPSKYVTAPYAVGKGKPPVEHQFQAGRPSPNPKGRPKGSKNKTDFEKLLDRRVDAGFDDRGRPIRKKLRELLDQRLVKEALNGDMRAMKIVKDFELRVSLARSHGAADPQTLAAEAEEARRKAELSGVIVKANIELLETVASLKRLGVIEWVEGKWQVQPWAIEAAAQRPQPEL